MGFEEFKKYHNANYHDGDSHFGERIYKKSNGDDFDCSFVQDCYDHFEAGAASRQAEIDALNALSEMSDQKIDDLVFRNIELQKNFDNALKTIEIQQRFLDDADGANKFLTSQVDELQKRIDDVLDKLSKDYYTETIDECVDILKGKKDE